MSKSFSNQTDKFERSREVAVKRLKKDAYEARQGRREKHWRNTGVSDSTVEWMRERDML